MVDIEMKLAGISVESQTIIRNFAEENCLIQGRKVTPLAVWQDPGYERVTPG
jgi:hypothetical protein